MSVTALQVESLPWGADSMHAWLRAGERWLDRAAGLDVTGVDDAGLVEATRRLGRAVARIDAVKLAVVAEVEARSAARRVTGATSTAAWLRADGMSAGAAARQVALAGSLAEHEPTRQALQSGRINAEQAQVITGMLDGLSDAVPDADKAAVETRLLADAAGWTRAGCARPRPRRRPGWIRAGRGTWPPTNGPRRPAGSWSSGAAGTGCTTCAGSSTPRPPPPSPPPWTPSPRPAPPTAPARTPAARGGAAPTPWSSWPAAPSPAAGCRSPAESAPRWWSP